MPRDGVNSTASETSELASSDSRRDPCDGFEVVESEAVLGRREVLKAGAGMAVAPLLVGVALAAEPNRNRNGKASVAAAADRSKEQIMDIQRAGTNSSIKGPSDWFTGTVWLDPMFDCKAPARTSGASVIFEPGARTAWHTHPFGQHIVITSGAGWVQQEGGKIQEVRPGDVVWFPPGVKHWHGARPDTAMTHIAIQEARGGSPVDWLEHVSDKQYQKGVNGE